MRSRFICVGAVVVLAAGIALAQIGTDVLGAHDLSPGGKSTIKGTLSGPCLYCHAPHSGINGTPGVGGTPLWSQKLSTATYQVYTSPTLVNKGNPSPPLGSDSTLCLSCHDGTVAPGTLTPYGKVTMNPPMSSSPTDLGTNLQSTHPFSLVPPLKTAPGLSPSLTLNPPHTDDTSGVVRLINGDVECTSCHNPHVQNIDSSGSFLVIDNSSSALCLACHTTVPTGPGMGMTAPAKVDMSAQATTRVVATQRNPLAQWTGSIHATAANRVTGQVPVGGNSAVAKMIRRQASLGSYETVRKNGCLSCHTNHNAVPKSLLRGTDDQACLSCHSGGSTISPPAANIYAEMASPKTGHLLAANGNNSHSAHESELLNHNRHATCADCHNPHAANQVGISFPAAPAIRVSQKGVVGISASDGQSVVSPAANQYENCLRCHGASTGKTANPALFGYLPNWVVSAPDALNVIPQFSASSSSSHPVTHDRSSPFPQPSLRFNMLNLDGSKQGHSLGARILCTDCHNSDDNREFGGTGPNGPHGSKYTHILERRYDMSQSPVPGQAVTNLNLPPNLSATGNYALCAKCHDLANIVSNASFREHARHINDGFSCSVCHTAHGMGAQAATVSGERMVNFDVNVVAPNGTTPIAYRRASNSCSLTCHGHAHNLAGAAPAGTPLKVRTK